MGCADPSSSSSSTDAIGEERLALTDDVPVDPGVAYELAFEVSTGAQRAYILYLPDDYVHDPDLGAPHPVVFMFHGLSGSAAGFAATLEAAGLRTLADEQDKIIVFLQGTVGLTVSDPGWWNTTSVGRDDVLYTEELLDHLADALNIDLDRVFAGGHSLGGRFVHELGSRIPDRFRAIADVSGFYSATLFGEPSPPSNGTFLPVLIVHGALDGVVPIDGGLSSNPLLAFLGIDFEPTQYTYDSWYDNNDCTEPTLRLLSQYWDIQTTDCVASEPDPVVQFVSVGGLGHWWPTAADFYDASSEMLAFFDMQ
jgi:polyhydroxybutyrate depolymerase